MAGYLAGYLAGLLVRLTGSGLLIWQAVTGHVWAQATLFALIVVTVELLNLTSPSLSSSGIRRGWRR